MKSVLVGYNDPVIISEMELLLATYCPGVAIVGKVKSCVTLLNMIKELNFQLLFIDTELCKRKDFNKIQNISVSNDSFETIFYTNKAEFSEEAFHCHALYYIINSDNKDELVSIVEFAKKRIENKRTFTRNKEIIKRHLSTGIPFDKIGIPTMEGIEYLDTSDIIRCEGLQKCTRIITKERSDIISAYNIGEFRKLLNPFGFFSPHKSHLINLRYVYKYHKEGTIIMKDKSYVPVARRRKSAFLSQIKLL